MGVKRFLYDAWYIVIVIIIYPMGLEVEYDYSSPP